MDQIWFYILWYILFGFHLVLSFNCVVTRPCLNACSNCLRSLEAGRHWTCSNETWLYDFCLLCLLFSCQFCIIRHSVRCSQPCPVCSGAQNTTMLDVFVVQSHQSFASLLLEFNTTSKRLSGIASWFLSPFEWITFHPLPHPVQEYFLSPMMQTQASHLTCGLQLVDWSPPDP